MIASVDYKFVLLMQQKTATTSFEVALKKYSNFWVGGKPRWKHITYREYQDIFGGFFESRGCEVIGVVRDPIQHMKSIYRFRKRENAPARASTRNVSFDEFVEAWASESPPKFACYSTPREFFMTEAGKPADISYFKFENLEKLVSHFSSLVGQQLELKKKNVSPAQPIPEPKNDLMLIPKMQREYEFVNSLKYVA